MAQRTDRSIKSSIKSTNMKKSIFQLSFITILLFALSKNDVNAQGGKYGGRELLGKWRLEQTDIAMKTPDGQVMKQSYKGKPGDYFDIGNGTMTSHFNGKTETSNYTIVGDDIVSEKNGKKDKLHIVTMTKDLCVLTKSEKTRDGEGEITMTMKR